ncbi:nuclear transport factor 2 family protein [Streptomyces sp. SLBN-8D4]|uniref:nuclear transport factor 2 family protein n=1 Tax=Streptomyces sp. SLBN-8D4 TaxID=3377728 RepID=UPI003C7AB7CB
MPAEGVPAAREALLRRMYEVFATDERDAFVPHCLSPDVDWPNMLDGGRLHGHEAVRAYWARQFAVGHPLVRLEGLRPGGSAGTVVVTVRLGTRDASGAERWSDETVEHVYVYGFGAGFGFGEDGLVTRMDVRAEA